MGPIQRHLRNTFLAGILAAIPLAITLAIIVYIESATREPVRALLGWNAPFVGFLIAIVLIYCLGLLISSLVGKWFLARLDQLLLRVPGLRELYQAWKHVSLAPGGKGGVFTKVVLIPVENDRQRTLGFTSGEPLADDPRTCCVFVPAAPNPTSGRLYFVPLKDCQVLDISIEEAFKIVLSGGNYMPPEVGQTLAITRHTSSKASSAAL